MKTRLMLTAALAALALATSCGIHQGIRRDSDTTNSFEYKLDVQELQYQRTAMGSATILSVFCLIPLGQDQYATAMADLLKNADLKKNEVLANYRDDFGFTGFPYIFCNQRLTVSADVIAVTPRGGPSAGSVAAP
jgi:hypothetical protein